MAKNDFTNNEIVLMFKEIKDTLERVETQVIKTNGRVSALEIWKEGFVAKLAGILGTISVAWVIIKEVILNK